MYGYSITVDRDLIIRAVVTPTGGQGFCPSLLKGYPLDRFFPVLLEDGSNAVKRVIDEGAPLFLRGYHTVCFRGDVIADISIHPVSADDGAIGGAEISLVIVSGCPAVEMLQKEQRLIDIGRYSAALAHGVRNPLNAIKGAVVYLKDAYGGERTFAEFAAIIEEEISKLDGFITRFLSTSLLESEFVPVDVNELLRRILAMNSFQAYAKKISLSSELGVVPIIMADAFQLEHAVMNVINNSFEAMAEDGDIRLKTRLVQRGGHDFVSILISDNGKGMSREGQSGVPGCSNEKKVEKGRGFGLFLTREIIQSHGGTIEIVSKKNMGTSVEMFLPVNRRDDA